MSLLDPNIQTVIATLAKPKSWKEKWISGTKPSWELKDEQGNLIGKYIMDEKKRWLSHALPI